MFSCFGAGHFYGGIETRQSVDMLISGVGPFKCGMMLRSSVMYPVLFSVFSFSINMSVSCVLTASFPLSRSSLINVIFILYRVCNILVKIRRERGDTSFSRIIFRLASFGVECLYVSFIKGVRFFAYPHSFVYFYTRVYEQSTKVVFLVHISERSSSLQ